MLYLEAPLQSSATDRNGSHDRSISRKAPPLTETAAMTVASSTQFAAKLQKGSMVFLMMQSAEG